MANAIFTAPRPRNEPVLGYAPGSPERRALRAELARLAGEVVEITPRIGGARVATGRTARTVTLSAGIAAFEGAGEWPTTETLVGAADAALYRAKNDGRNCVRD